MADTLLPQPTANPVLTEIMGLSPAAKTALGMAGHTVPSTPQSAAPASSVAPIQMPDANPVPKLGASSLPGNTTTPNQAAQQLIQASSPAPAPIRMPGPSVPKLGASPIPNTSNTVPTENVQSNALIPNVKVPQFQPQTPGLLLPKGTIGGDEAERQRLLQTGSGEDQIYGKIANSNFGQNHPFFGKLLGGLAEGAAKVGDIGLSAVAPSLAINMPGTAYHHQLLLNKANDALASDYANEETGATTDFNRANTQHLNAETMGIPLKAQDEHDLARAQIGDYDAQAYDRMHPKAEVEIHDTPQGLMRIDKQAGTAQPVTANGQAVGSPVKTVPPQVIMVNGVPHDILFDEAGHKIADLGVHYEKPTPEPGSWSLAEDATGKPVLLNSKSGLIKDAPGDIAKPGTHAKAMAPYQAIVDDASMAHQLADAANQGNAPADVDLALSFFKTMKGAGGSGIRFTQAEQNMIRGARSSGQDLTGIAQKVLGGGQFFTPDQRNKIVQVIDMHAEAARQHITSMNGSGGDSEIPAGMVQVQIPGQHPGYIPSSALKQFKKDHPNAQVVQ